MAGSFAPRILNVSAGSIGMRHMRNARELIPDARIGLWRLTDRSVAIEEPAVWDETFTTLKQAMDFSPDLVIVSCPANRHLEIALPFAEKSLPIFLEKPLCRDDQDYNNLLGLVQQSNAPVMIGYVLRFLPSLLRVKEILNSGELGEIISVDIQVGQFLPDWRPTQDYRKTVSASKELGGGVLLELSHEIDYALWLFGLPNKMSCSTGRSDMLDIDVEDQAVLTFVYDAFNQDSGSQIRIEMDFLQKVAKRQLIISGSKGNVVADLIKGEVLLASGKHQEVRKWQTCSADMGNHIYLKQFDCFFAEIFSSYVSKYDQSFQNFGYATISEAKRVIDVIRQARRIDGLASAMPLENVDG
ncbi:MAG: Gfo/Idh/MocA family oxidoreductase [Alphaproteobacteria bacterium]|nr:Gfo/Idh/MocA family oxidoreductase [Alphaproteobacteria bacterium]